MFEEYDCSINAPVELDVPDDVVEAELNSGNNQIQNEERAIHRKYTTRFTSNNRNKIDNETDNPTVQISVMKRAF